MRASKTCLTAKVLWGMLACFNLGSEAQPVSGIAMDNHRLGHRSIADLSYSSNGIVHHRRHLPIETRKRAANKKGNDGKKGQDKNNDNDSNPGPYGDNNALEKINEGQKRNPKATEEPKAEVTLRNLPVRIDMGGDSSDNDDHDTD